MLLAQISDTHILAGRQADGVAAHRAANLDACVADINRQRPDAVIFTGDTVQHGRPEEYARLLELLAPLHAPLYPIPGNRDDNANFGVAFRDLSCLPDDSTALCYAVSHPELRLVGLDSTAPGERKGCFPPDRQRWLDDTLARHPDCPTLLFIHHPPFDVGDHYVGGYAQPGDAAALGEIVRRHRQVVRILCGHVHWPVETSWAATSASIMPSVAVDVRKGIEETDAAGRPVYMLHSYRPGRGITSRLRFAAAHPAVPAAAG